MPPLSPLSVEATKKKPIDSKTETLIIESTLGSRFTYSINQLYNLRSGENRSPIVTNQVVFEAIRRSENIENTNRRNMFQFNAFPSSNMNRLGNRSNRSILRPSSILPMEGNMQSPSSSQRSGNSFQNQISFNRDRLPYMGRNSSGRGSQTRSTVSNDEFKLKEAENAWKPSFLNRIEDKSQTEELYRQVRSILNKLTTSNFGVLSEQFRKLKIDTKDKLSDVVDFVFEKAVNEPNFSVGYAQLCSYLAERSKEFVTTSSERAYFKRMLITKCQIEFEQNVANKNKIEVALAPLMDKLKLCEKNGNSIGFVEAKEKIADEESKLRRRLVSTVRFIGELYKLDMLTKNIMNICIKSLVESKTDEKLECLCKLLTTVGGKLERKPTNEEEKIKYLNLSDFMNQLKQIAERKIPNVRCSTRVKFMIMDVIELRANKWNPKTPVESKVNV